MMYVYIYAWWSKQKVNKKGRTNSAAVRRNLSSKTRAIWWFGVLPVNHASSGGRGTKERDFRIAQHGLDKHYVVKML